MRKFLAWLSLTPVGAGAVYLCMLSSEMIFILLGSLIIALLTTWGIGVLIEEEKSNPLYND